MKKNICLAAALLLCMAGMSSCANKSEKSEEKQGTAATATTAVKKEKKAEMPKDVFVYTAEHRKSKYQPTEAVIGFSKKIGSVNEGEFKDNKNIREVWIGEQIKHITNGAFQGCTALEQIHFMGEMPLINDDAFTGCSSLKELNVNVGTIGLNAFDGCKSLESVKLGNKIYQIRAGAFANCTSLKQFIAPIELRNLENGAFEGCTAMEEFSIPNSLKNRMFGMFPQNDKWRKVYLLTTEYYKLPKNCTPTKECTLYVPDAFLEQFRKDADWSKFGKIEPLSSTEYFQAVGFSK